jgi:Resolvase, N terminal domain
MCPRSAGPVCAAGRAGSPDGRVADLVTEPGQLAVHSAVSPGRVLSRQPQRKLAYFLADPGPAWPVGIRPLALDQLAVPGQHGARHNQPMGAPCCRHPPGQRRQDRSVGPVQLRPRDLTPQHRDFVAEDHDLRILGTLAAAQQHQPAKDPDHDQVEQAKGHKPRSCRNEPIRPNRSSQHLRRVLKRYRPGDTLVVWKLDRLGRSVKEVLTIADDLHGRGIGVRILTGKLSGSYTPHGEGKFFFTMMAAFAELERDIIHERTMAGLAATRAQGKVGGRPAVMDPDELAAARARRERGENPAQIGQGARRQPRIGIPAPRRRKPGDLG